VACWVTCLHLGFGVFDFGDFKGIGWGAIDTIVYLIAHLQRNIPCGVYQKKLTDPNRPYTTSSFTLRHIPGPFLAKVSKLLSYHDLAGSHAATLHGVHNKYGTIVRIAPDELSFSDPAVIKEIYSQGTLLRNHLSITASLEAHRQGRKLLGNAFAKSSVVQSEPLVAEQVRKFMGWVWRKEGMVINVYDLKISGVR
jgi:cytochrome P450